MSSRKNIEMFQKEQVFFKPLILLDFILSLLPLYWEVITFAIFVIFPGLLLCIEIYKISFLPQRKYIVLFYIFFSCSAMISQSTQANRC